MELTPVPRRAPVPPRVWGLVLAALLGPLLVLVLVPSVLGLDRYVATSDALGRDLPRGSLVFAEEVPGSDLRVGDVVTFPSPAHRADGRLVTRRVASLAPGSLRTRSESAVDPWVLSSGRAYSRAVLHLPYAGYPFLGSVDRRQWLMLASVPLTAFLLAVAGDLVSHRRRRLATRS